MSFNMDINQTCKGVNDLDREEKFKDNCIEVEVPFNFIQYLNSEDCKIENLCRICLSVFNGNMFSIKPTDNSNSLPEMFEMFTSIHVQNDGLPSCVCDMCKTQIIYCYNFKTKCLKSDYALKSFLKGAFANKNEMCAGDIPIKSEADTRHSNSIIADIAAKSNIKFEDDICEDVQYLEDLSDVSDNELCIAQNTLQNIKEKISNSESNLINNDSFPKNVKDTVFLVPALNRKSKSKSSVCNICSKRFVNSKTLKAHTKRIHSSQSGEVPHSCSQCKDSFNSDHDLKLHSNLHLKGPPWKCVECNKEFMLRSMLRRHVQRHMQSKRYTCEVCNKPFSELYALRRHLRVHTGEQVEKRHACHLCSKRYSESNALAAHLSRHRGERPCVCATCGKSFPSARLLASHHLVHSDVKPYPCQYCDKRFRHESTRNTHHRTHTGEKPYVCSICGKTFVQNSNLTLHMRTHTGEKPYTCDQCGRKFSSGSSLKNHQRSHTGEKPYSCSICLKRFARGDMRAHMAVHSGARPYACSLCARAFTREARLREHCRIHTGEKPFECAVCSRKFVTKSHLVKHVKTHQPKKKKIEREVVIVRQVDYDQPYLVAKKFVITKENDAGKKPNVKSDDHEENYIGTEVTESDAPLAVSEELILPGDIDSDMKSDLLVVDNSETDLNHQNGAVCLNTNEVSFLNNDINYATDVNLVTVNEGEVSISASSAMLEGTTVKLYQLDQSLVQIHSVGGQVTISKITSKMTANF